MDQPPGNMVENSQKTEPDLAVRTDQRDAELT